MQDTFILDRDPKGVDCFVFNALALTAVRQHRLCSDLERTTGWQSRILDHDERTHVSHQRVRA